MFFFFRTIGNFDDSDARIFIAIKHNVVCLDERDDCTGFDWSDTDCNINLGDGACDDCKKAAADSESTGTFVAHRSLFPLVLPR